MERVLLVRLNANDGYYSFADCLPLVGVLQSQGVDAICEQSPGALMDSQDSYLLKVPADQVSLAKTLLEEHFSSNNSV